MIKVCSFVMNSVSRDARVLKQAKSLAGAGYDVTIIGVMDDNYSVSYEKHDDGFVIRRVSLANIYYILNSFKKIIISLFLLFSIFLICLIDYSSYISIVNVENIKYLIIFAVFIFVFNKLLLQLIYFKNKITEGISFNEFDELADFESTANNNQQKINLILIVKKILDIKVFISSNLNKLNNNINYVLWFYFRLLPSFILALKIKPDVVHCHDVYTLPIGLLFKLRSRAVFVYDAHEIYEELSVQRNLTRLFRLSHVVTQRFIDGFVTINESIADWYSKKYHHLPKAEIIKNATVLNKKINYDFRLHDKAGIDHNKKILLYQGGYAKNRGLFQLLEAAEYFPTDWCIVMMGWGNIENDLKQIANIVNQNLSGSNDKVIYFIPPAPQEELQLWTSGATIGIIPYENVNLNHWFCTPNKLWEYPAAGVPIMVSPFPELSKPITEYGIGWLMDEKFSPENLGNLLSSLSGSEIEKAKSNTIKYINENHWGIYQENLIEFYKNINNKGLNFNND